MTQAVATRNESAVLEQVIVGGNLANLTGEQRVSYYNRVCESLNLNPFTRPFEYLTLNGKLTLYARKDCTDQLRKNNGVSITKPDIQLSDGLCIVTVTATDKAGRCDADLGAVAIEGLKGEARANAMMKAITKAKRRVTLSICGLGWLDESETDSIPDARPVTVDAATGEILDAAPAPRAAPVDHSPLVSDPYWERYQERVNEAAEAGMPTADYLVERSGLTQARVIELGFKLKAAMDAHQAAQPAEAMI